MNVDWGGEGLGPTRQLKRQFIERHAEADDTRSEQRMGKGPKQIWHTLYQTARPCTQA